MKHRELDDELCAAADPTEVEIEMLVAQRSGSQDMYDVPQRAARRSHSRLLGGRGRNWTCLCSGSGVQCFGVSEPRPNSSILTHVWGFGKLQGGLVKGCTRRRPWEAGEAIAYKGCWGNYIKILHLLVTLCAVH